MLSASWAHEGQVQSLVQPGGPREGAMNGLGVRRPGLRVQALLLMNWVMCAGPGTSVRSPSSSVRWAAGLGPLGDAV